MGPVHALAKAYEDRRRWTLEMPYLGLPGAERGKFSGAIFPMPPIGEFTKKTKAPHIICLEIINNGGIKEIVPLAGPASWPAMRQLTKRLVNLGAHPLDIVVATWDSVTDDFTFRSAVDHPLWTSDDQDKLSLSASDGSS